MENKKLDYDDKEAFSHEKAMDIILQGRRSHFDPVMIDVFLKNHLEFRDIFDRLLS